MKTTAFRAAVLSILPAVAVAAGDAPLSIRSGPARTSLVELFTSEGCSSCPPAERRLAALKDEPGLWRDFVPVAWHVDYWDGLGWPDRFASADNTRRQEEYAAAWHSQNIYTPALVVDGAERRGGWVPPGTGAPGRPEAGVLEVKSSGTNRFAVSYLTTPAGGGHPELSATVAWLGIDRVSDVKRGENAGKILRHGFVVLRSATVPLRASGDGLSAAVSLAIPADEPGGRLALASWVSGKGSPAPFQAAGGWWPPPAR